MTEDNLVRHLIQDAGNTENENRITIFQHPLRQGCIETSPELQLRDKQKHDGRCTDQVEEEGIENIASTHPYIINKVEGDVQNNE